MNGEIRSVLFDFDGTLYEDERVYERYAHELSTYLPESVRGRFLAEWDRAKSGRSVARVGRGYDLARDLLFRHDGDRIVAYLDWEGRESPPRGPVAAGEVDEGGETPLETPAFGPERFSIGDWWRLPDVLAAHFGVPSEERAAAFRATREYMTSETFHLELEPGMRELLADVHGTGRRLVAMSNSPASSVGSMLAELRIGDCFDLVITDAKKPLGMRRYLAGLDRPEELLSIGDFYVNEIEPAVAVGCAALYIDRHHTGFGMEYERCVRVQSIPAAIDWARAHLLHG